MAVNPVDEPGEVPVCCTHLFDVFALLGKRWSGLIIGVLLNRPARFGELQRAIPGIRGPMLSRRLDELGGAGLVERHVDGGPPVAVSYRLTAAGEALRPAIRELTMWAQSSLHRPVAPSMSVGPTPSTDPDQSTAKYPEPR